VYQGIVWTGFDAASRLLVTAEAAVPQLGLLTLIGKTIVGFRKSAKSGAVRTGFIDTVISRYGEVTESVMDSVKKTYAEFDLFADETLENSYRSRLEESVAAVKQASEIAAMNESERKEAASGIEALRGSFEALSARFAG
jgi:deoxyhypusine synthase